MHASDEVRCPLTGRPLDARAGGSVPPPPPSSPPPSAAPANDGRSLIGQILEDKYRPTAILGEGGMGAVYEAEHLLIGRRVALKVLHPAHAQRRDAVWRFHHEARVAGSIGHPNICEIYDVGQLEDGSPYLVMERLHGETLADRIERDAELPVVDVIDVTLQVLSALVAAHEKGVIHRDIKPENIFLSERPGFAPLVKLLDFGISKAVDDDSLHLTRTGMVMGTPYYMAPEQARGEVIDARIDLYAVGILLYESLTGQRPFAAANYSALLRLILFEEPRPMRELRPALPEASEHVVRRALAKDRDQRFQSAQEFMAALAALRAEMASHRQGSSEFDRPARPYHPSDRPPGPPPSVRGPGGSPSVGPWARPSAPPPEAPAPRTASRPVPAMFSNEATRHGLGPMPPSGGASRPPGPFRPSAPPAASPPPHAAVPPPAASPRATLPPPAASPRATMPPPAAPPPAVAPPAASPRNAVVPAVFESDPTMATAPLNVDEAEAIVRSAAERAKAAPGRPSRAPGPTVLSRPAPPSSHASPPPLPGSARARSAPPDRANAPRVPMPSHPPLPASMPRPAVPTTSTPRPAGPTTSTPRPAGVGTAPPPPLPYRPKHPSLPPLPPPGQNRGRSEAPRPAEGSPPPTLNPPAPAASPSVPGGAPLPPPSPYRGPLPPPPGRARPPEAPREPHPPPPNDRPALWTEEEENLPTRLYRPKPGDLPIPPRGTPPKKEG